MSLLLVFLRIAWPYLLGAILLGAGYWQANHWCNTVCKEARAERDELAVQKAAAIKRATDLALLWSAEVDRSEIAARQRKERNAALFAPLTNRARSVPRGGVVAVSPAAARVFVDAAAAANAPAAPAGREAGADPIPDAAPAAPVIFDEREFADWVVTAAMAYADARNQWGACVEHYERLRTAQPEGKP